MPGSLGFLKPDLPEAASTALNPVSRATGFTLFGFDLKIERCCRTNIAVFLPFLLSFSPTHTHTPFPTLTEKLTEFPDELEGKGTQLTSHDARGSCESAAGKPGEDADNGKQDAKETSQKGGEGARETERGE